MFVMVKEILYLFKLHMNFYIIFIFLNISLMFLMTYFIASIYLISFITIVLSVFGVYV